MILLYFWKFCPTDFFVYDLLLFMLFSLPKPKKHDNDSSPMRQMRTCKNVDKGAKGSEGGGHIPIWHSPP